MSDPLSQNDRTLENAVLEGEEAAIHQLQTWVAQSSASFRRRLGFEWDDLQQELIVEVLEALGAKRWQGSGALEGFVRRTVVHSCIDRIRHHDRWRFVSPELLSRRPDPAKTVEESYLGVLAIAEKMPADCRQLWRMVLEGFSYREMSVRVGVREGTLRARVRRCRERAKALRRELEPTTTAIRERREGAI